MKRRRLAGILAIAAVALLAALAAGCGGGSSDSGGGDTTAPADTSGSADTSGGSEGGEGNPQPGGTYRVGWESSFDFTDAFDVTGEYTALGWSLYTLFVRKLVTYIGAPAPEGNEIVPDLATDTGTLSDDGLTYTFTLKDGIKFGPPVNREITSKDFVTAFDRIANPDIGGFGYPLYYTTDQGLPGRRRREGEDDLGNRDAGRQDDRLPSRRSRPETSSTGSPCRRRPASGRGDEVLHQGG